MKTSLKERKYVEMHVSILESGDGGTIKENIARGGIFMRDQEITELFWERKEQAVTESNIRYGAYCRRISYNILANKEDVEECMNDTWFRAWNSMPTERPGILQAFLGAITRNLSLDRYRKNHSKKRGEGEISYIYEEMQDCISGENMELHVENMELAEMINRFLAGMKTENRRIFVRRYWYFDSIAEIAKRFSISESKVKSSLMRSRESLRKCLAQEGIEV